jgi:UDPglucose--hexose-1-phosphate uridylyltransferase
VKHKRGNNVLNEIRKDYLLDRWVIIAAERAKRPTDFVAKSSEKIETKTENCPFCPGNERMTPPAVLLYLPNNGGIRREKDRDSERRKDWLVRCVPNLYPALTSRRPVALSSNESLRRVDGVGVHEVIIESPRHNEHPDRAPLKQVELVVQAYVDRLKSLSKWDYVSIFRNHRKEAGASLSHAHSQIIATPIIPKMISDELIAVKTKYQQLGVCPYCKIIKSERNGPRHIYENEKFIAFAPWASVYPFEFWLFPKKHQQTLLQLQDDEKKDLAKALRTCLGSLAKILNDPPYCHGFHIAPTKGSHEYFHWHLEVYPKLTIHAGFEISTGMFINVTPPEIAAESLRRSLLNKHS